MWDNRYLLNEKTEGAWTTEEGKEFHKDEMVCGKMRNEMNHSELVVVQISKNYLLVLLFRVW